MEMTGHKKQKKFTVPCFSNPLHIYICFLTLSAFSARASNAVDIDSLEIKQPAISCTEIRRKEINLGNRNINQNS